MAFKGFPKLSDLKIPPQGLMDPSLRKGGGIQSQGDFSNVCSTPGRKIRSGGKGRGLARGKGRGPLGMPIRKKKDWLMTIGHTDGVSKIGFQFRKRRK